MALIAGGALLMVGGAIADEVGHLRIVGLWLSSTGSILLGLGLLRRHTVLVVYFGKSKARWMEVIQITTAIVAYGLTAAGDLSNDPESRLTLRVLSLIPFALHFLLVWLPITRSQERALAEAHAPPSKPPMSDY
jgi:hypothetical protein